MRDDRDMIQMIFLTLFVFLLIAALGIVSYRREKARQSLKRIQEIQQRYDSTAAGAGRAGRP